MNKNIKYGIVLLIGIYIIVKITEYETNPKEFNVKLKECPQIEKALVKKCIKKNGKEMNKRCEEKIKELYTEKYITIDKMTKTECELAKIGKKLSNGK